MTKSLQTLSQGVSPRTLEDYESAQKGRGNRVLRRKNKEALGHITRSHTNGVAWRNLELETPARPRT